MKNNKNTVRSASLSKHELNSLDVKTALLQGKAIERTKLRSTSYGSYHSKNVEIKCVYGLADASHYWYLKFREELIKLGATPRQLDIFLYY